MSVPVTTKIGHGLARVLRIDLNQGQRARDVPVSYASTHSQEGAETYIEEEPTVAEWFKQFEPSLPGAVKYTISLLPFLTWIGRYNLKWLYGDLVAGITVGCVVIPQGSKSIAYFFC
jgi:solute carrier family 26 (sodium-independent sulfate anion transporter), member 11